MLTAFCEWLSSVPRSHDRGRSVRCQEAAYLRIKRQLTRRGARSLAWPLWAGLARTCALEACLPSLTSRAFTCCRLRNRPSLRRRHRTPTSHRSHGVRRGPDRLSGCGATDAAPALVPQRHPSCASPVQRCNCAPPPRSAPPTAATHGSHAHWPLPQ